MYITEAQFFSYIPGIGELTSFFFILSDVESILAGAVRAFQFECIHTLGDTEGRLPPIAHISRGRDAHV